MSENILTKSQRKCSVIGCNNKYYCKTVCDKHYRRLRKYNKTSLPTTKDKFFSNIATVPESGCWLWTGSVGKHGYGSITTNKIIKKVHRFSWEYHNKKEIPEGMHICHRCDIPCCVNPDHLFLGTHKDNMDDRDKKGRNAAKKVSDEQISVMKSRRSSGETYASISNDFPVCLQQVYNICNK